MLFFGTATAGCSQSHSHRTISGRHLGHRRPQFFERKRFLQNAVHAPGRPAVDDEVFRKSRGHDDGLAGPEQLDAGDQFVTFISGMR